MVACSLTEARKNNIRYGSWPQLCIQRHNWLAQSLHPSSQAKYFLCPITRGRCFLYWRDLHSMAPCFPQTLFPVFFAEKNHWFRTRGIRTCWNSHFSKQNIFFFARQSGENWRNSSRTFDYWETDVWHPLCSPGRDKLIWKYISLYAPFVLSQSVRYRIKLSK